MIPYALVRVFIAFVAEYLYIGVIVAEGLYLLML